jgi:predicted flap endonuclease-1-like 5' DNA nuclease
MQNLVVFVVGFMAGWMISRLMGRGVGQPSLRHLPEAPQGQELDLSAAADWAKAELAIPEDVQDDLTRIMGIGPVFERRLVAAGIRTYAQLAQTSPDRLREIVSAADWQKVDTEQWIEQAAGLIH